MKVTFEQKANTDCFEGAIRLINNSSHMLQNITLSFDTLPYNLLECKVVRERGSLCFSPPETSIPLGNLYPEEVASLYCKLLPSPSLSLTPTEYVHQIKVSFAPENSELGTYLLSELLSPHTSPHDTHS